MKRCRWVEPVLVAQIKFTEWTLDDQLHQPVFLGLRTDKHAKDVIRE
jgi:bifunctional non-homologous end joining protein LigD